MAAPTQQRKQVPKVFSERAKVASVQAQVANDILEAQVKGALAQRKASLKAQSNAANFMGSQLDSAAQARADAEAQGQEAPVGPELDVAPLPNASQPSQGLAGATGLDLNALLTAPGAVQGGAGIQAATGGMGRAGGGAGGSDPTGGAQMPGNVPPYLTSQRTTNTTQQFGDASGVLRVPVSSTVTEVTPNVLSPYEAGKLQEASQRTKLLQVQQTLTSVDSLAENLAAARYGMTRGYLDPKNYLDARQAAQETLTQMGLAPEMISLVESRAQSKFGQYATERLETSSTEYMKTLHERDMQDIGTPTWVELNERLKQLSGRSGLDQAQRRHFDMLTKGPVIETQERNARQVQTIGLLKRIKQLSMTNPEAFGFRGTLQSGATAIGSIASELSSLFPKEVQDQLVAQATEEIPNMIERSIGPDGKADPETVEIVRNWQRQLYDPKTQGTLGQLESALQISYAGIYFKTLNVRAVETIMKSKIKLTGAQTIDEVQTALDTALKEAELIRHNTELHMKDTGIPVLPYREQPMGADGAYKGALPGKVPGVIELQPRSR